MVSSAHDGPALGPETRVRSGVFFTVPPSLPRGRHDIPRASVLDNHRERLMIAATELLAADGYGGIGVREVCARAAMSRAAFYNCFRDKDECVFTAYDRFIEVLIGRLTRRDAPDARRDTSIDRFVDAYLRTLQEDLVVARAFQVEMDALGRPARDRRRAALVGLAGVIRDDQIRAGGGGGAPLIAYIGVVYAVRQIVSDALDSELHPDLPALGPTLTPWASRLLG